MEILTAIDNTVDAFILRIISNYNLILNKITPIRYTNKDNDNLIQLYWTTLK